MGIGDFFKRLTKGAPKEEDSSEPPVPQTQPMGHRRRAMTPLHGWAKKDNAFVRPDMGMMQPPEDMAEEASFKRPDSWLKKKLGGGGDSQALENLEKTKDNRGKPKALSDQDLEAIFEGLLGEEEDPPPAEEANKKE